MFDAGNATNPANKWTKVLSKFYDKYHIKVKSHDFRATMVTNFYEKTKDINQARQFVGHTSVMTT